ncbi:MAG: FtsW/RodA/SpoVE family cell cycle protein [Clostridia bacterium]|nr:MAG: FtsW/RodA/SpoVE family cell cycle protein [Clostridia bacterium]
MPELDNYLEDVCAHIKNRAVHDQVKEELRVHLEELFQEALAAGNDEGEAARQACRRLGEPGALGKELDRIHRLRTDRRFFASLTLLSLLGLLVLYTAPGDTVALVLRRSAGTLLGLALVLWAPRLDYRRLLGAGKILFPAGLTLLALSTLGAQVPYGAAAWLFALGLLFTLLAWSGLLAELNKSKQQDFFLALGYLALPVVALLAWEKVTPAAILALTSLALLGRAGFSRRQTVLGMLSLVLLPGVAFLLLAAPYQLARLAAFLRPEAYADGYGYVPLMLRDYLGSGGIFGTGIGRVWNTLPPGGLYNEYILAPFVQQTGLVGGLILMLAAGLFLGRLWRTAGRNNTGPGSLLLAGTAAFFAVRLVWNMGMISGLLPVTAVGLPFVSHDPAMSFLDFTLVALAAGVLARSPRPAALPASERGGNGHA